jgi:hypothetical protein
LDFENEAAIAGLGTRRRSADAFFNPSSGRSSARGWTIAQASSEDLRRAGVGWSSLHRERLHVQFDSPEALRSEFEKNIANRGLFVTTAEPYAVRQPVAVEIELVYLEGAGGADCPGGVLELEGEVVHRIPPEMAGNGVVSGVAIQLDDSAQALRERFTPLLGKRAVREVDEDRDGARRRSARRNAVRVPVRVMPSTREPFEATSRDLSSTGILLSLRDERMPVGESVRICLWHPSGEPSVVVDGVVAREVQNRSGRVAAAAVAFDRSQLGDPGVRSVIDALREAGLRSQLGGISGSLADLGLANLLQMFGTSAPQGTIVVEHEGQLLLAELGPLEGRDALVAMLDWADGRFEFQARADEKLLSSAVRRPLAGAVLDALCLLDERDRDAEKDDPSASIQAEDTIVFGAEGVFDPGLEIGPHTTFDVDPEQQDRAGDLLDKTQDALIDLARSGMSCGRMLDVIPESDEVIQSALARLVEIGILLPR